MRIRIFIILCVFCFSASAQVNEFQNILCFGNQDYIDFNDRNGQYHRININNEVSSLPFIKTDSIYRNFVGLARLEITLLDNFDTLKVSSVKTRYMFVEDVLSGEAFVMYDSSFISTPYSKCDIILPHVVFESIQQQIKILFDSYTFYKDATDYKIPEDMKFEIFFKFRFN